MAPVVTTSTGTLAYLQNQAATPIDPGVTVTDSDSTTLTGATVSLLGPSFNPSQDVLGFTPQSGITGSYSATTGILTFSGTASVAAYQTVLQSVTYFNSSNFPNGGLLAAVSRTVKFTVNDGDAINGIDSAFRSIVITPINHAPTLGDCRIPAASPSETTSNSSKMPPPRRSTSPASATATTERSP